MTFFKCFWCSSPHIIQTVVCFIVITVLCDSGATKCGADRPTLLPESDAMHFAALLMLKDTEAQNSPMMRVSSVVMLVGRKGAKLLATFPR